MPLDFHLAEASEYPRIEALVIESFEPISWIKRLEDRMGPLNGRGWRMRWKDRLRHVFETQTVLVGAASGEIAAMSSGTLDPLTALVYIDLLAVDRRYRRRGYGRQMLRGMMEYMKGIGGQYVYLDCLIDNDTGNALYRTEGFEEVVRQVRWFRRIPSDGKL